MKGLIIIIAVFLATPAARAGEESLLARVTVYWASGKGSDRDTRQHKTATGLRLRTGHCAVDPRHIPYGSRVILADGTNLAAVDTGSAVKNRKAARRSGRTINERNSVVVDRFFETKSQALAWANRHSPFMSVRVVSPDNSPSQLRSSHASDNSAVPSHSPASIAIALPPVKYSLFASDESSVAGNRLNKLGR